MALSLPATPANAAGPFADGELAVISADGDCLNLRSMPTIDGAILACVDDGTVVTARGAQHEADGYCWEAVTALNLNGWMADDYLAPAGGGSNESSEACGDDGDDGDDDTTTEPGEPNSLPVPPPGRLTEGVAGTSDIDALIAAQAFDIASIWVFEPATQIFRVHIPGAPPFVNTLDSSSLTPDSIVMLLRNGTAPERGEAPTADDEAPRGVANVLPTPPEDGLTLGVSGSNDPAVLAASQPFEVKLIAMLDVPSQRWLTYVPGAPDVVQTLTRGLLQPDSIVWLRAGAVTTPEPEPEPEPEPAVAVVEARITYFYCNQGTISAGIGDGGGFCGHMANGEIVHEGAAACSRDNFGQRFRIVGDPLGLTYTCKDTGNAVHGEQRDIWFDNSDDGLNFIRQVGATANVEILAE